MSPPSISVRPVLRRQAPLRAARTPPRFTIERIFDPLRDSTLAEDVREGLSRQRKSIPPKHFYDARGSELFDAICELSEYYLTRAEQSLLDAFAADVLRTARPTDLVELGSGAARKTRALLDAAAAEPIRLRYHPFDVCEPMLRSSARALLAAYPWLTVHAIVGDYERHLDRLPRGARRLVAFLGSTIGNLSPRDATEFVAAIGAMLRPGEHLLLGADLVKPAAALEAAYDDGAGVTAEFNRNVLRVVNRELDADFDVEGFDHVAFFDRRRARVEMHLRARRAQRVSIAKLGMTVELEAGETIHTEISRKFTRRRLAAMCRGAGFALRRFYATTDPAFALLLAEKLAR